MNENDIGYSRSNGIPYDQSIIEQRHVYTCTQKLAAKNKGKKKKKSNCINFLLNGWKRASLSNPINRHCLLRDPSLFYYNLKSSFYCRLNKFCINHSITQSLIHQHAEEKENKDKEKSLYCKYDVCRWIWTIILFLFFQISIANLAHMFTY